MARINFFYLLVSTHCSGLLMFLHVYFSRSPLGMPASILGRLHGIFFYGVLHRGPLRMSLLSG